MPQNPLVGGTVLRRAAIQSPNFVQSPLAGWAINADGSAYFANLTLSGVFNGTDYILNAAGAFFYSSTPALGNLIISLASTAGTDAFGNAYPKGINVTTGTISGTTVSGTTISGSEFDGTDFVINTSGFFFYSGVPASGNLIASVANSAGSDSFGNAYLPGHATYGSSDPTQTGYLSGNVLALSTSADTYTLAPTSSPDALVLASTAGAFMLAFGPSSAQFTGGQVQVDELLAYSGPGTVTILYTSSSTFTGPTGVTHAAVECWAGSGGGGSAAGGGGGSCEYAAELANTITAGNVYTVTVGVLGGGGTGGASHNGNDGGNSSFSGTGATTVTANKGKGGLTAGGGGAGGTGSTNTTHHDGKAGGSSTGGSHGGGGGGGGAGSGGSGTVGQNASGNTPGGGGSGGSAAAGSLAGGAGSGGGWGGSSPTAGGVGGAPGGGGGAGGWDGASNLQAGGNGARGQVRVTYTAAAALVASLAGAAGTATDGSAYPAGLMGITLKLPAQSPAPSAASGAAVIYADTNNNAEKLLPSGYAAPISTSAGSVTTHTVTQSGDTALTDNWSIPASDLKAGTVYALRAKGYGEWATSGPQNLTLGTGIDGSTVRSETISSALFATSQHFEWDLEYTLLCISTGVSGKVWLAGRMTISAVGFTHTLTTGQVTILLGSNDSPGSSGGETLDTTAAHTMQLMAHWATTTGTPTITTRHQTFDRVGT